MAARWALFVKRNEGKWYFARTTEYDEHVTEFEEEKLLDPDSGVEAIAVINLEDHVVTQEKYLKENGLELDSEGRII